MRKHSRMKTLVLASLFLGVALAVPISLRNDVNDADDDALLTGRTSDAKCSTHCPQRSLPWSYEVGTTYTYSYSVDTATSMKGTSDQESKLGLKATVEMTVNTPCDFSMKIRDVSLTEGDSVEFSKDVERHEVHFSFVDGRIADVCSSPDETSLALNIKKGVLSAFQLNTDDWTKSKNITETDVIGVCSTEYVPSGSSLAGHLVFQKIKDMKSCRFNQKLFQFALNLPDLNIQHMSLLDSSHSCEIELSEGQLTKSVCDETHIFKPFSSGDHGATTSQYQIIQFVSASPSNQVAPSRGLTKRGYLLYDHHVDIKDAESNEVIVNQLLADYPGSDESQRPEMFTSLVHSLRHLHHSQLTHIFYKIQDFPTRKFVLDAIPLLRTDAAITLMRDIIASGQLNDVTLDNWFASLAFYKNPTRAMVTTVATFLDDNPRESAILAISSLVRTFCESQTNCQQLPEVQDIILKYEQYLGSDCGGSEGAITLDGEDEDRIILTLKGLRNIGQTLRSGPILEKCYLEKTNSMYIRLAALDTLKMLSCKSKIHEAALVDTFAETENDSELRIGAYLGIMNCPTEATIETVKSVLLSEPVNQVGSFVWTHLTNLQESQSMSPSKMTAKKLVGDRFLKNKWNTDVRKFSRYFETSYYAKELQAGATVEGNLIFSQESYLPRSAMVNLSVNVFGENLNLLELGGRAEGFEPLVEGLFGPDGRFREDTFHKLLQGMRSKRDANDMNDFQSTFNTLREDKPKGNFYVRTFGRDTHYSSFHGMNELFNKVSMWPNSIFGATWNGNDIDFRRSSIFLDGSIVVPTAAGLPLKLSVNGTSTVGLKSSTKLDVSNFFIDGKLSAEAHIFPSATVQVTGLMEVDAGFAKTGLKSVTKLHSSTFLDGKILIEGGQLARVEMNMPRDIMEILDATADFYTWQARYGDSGEAVYAPLESNNEQEVYIGCSTDGNDLFGVEVCAVAKYHYTPENELALYFTGPSAAKLSLKKTDQFQKYVFEYSWTTKNVDESSNKLVNDIKVTYDTPGSLIVRRSSMELKFDNDLSFLSLGLEIPINKINVDLVYNWTTEKKMIKAGLAVDRKNVLFLYSIFKVADDQGKYGAEARITYYDTDFLRWVGTVVLQEKRKSLDLKLEGSLHNSLKLTGDLYTSLDRYDLTSSLRSSVISLDFAGQLRHTDTSLAVKADASYKMASIGSHNVNIDGSYQMGSLGKLMKHHAQISINPSQFPSLKTDITWDTQLSSDYIENSGKMKIGSRAYNVEQVFSSQANDLMQELLFKLAITDAINDLQYKVDFLHKISEMESNNRLALSFRKHHMEAFALHKMTSSPAASLNISTGLTFPGGHNYAAGFEVAQQQSNDYAGKTFARWGSAEETDKKISADFTLQKGNEAYINYGFSVTVVLPNLQTLTSTGTLIFDPAAGSVLHLGWSRNHRHYSAEIEYSVIDLEHKIDAALTINNVEYKATLTASDRDIKSIVIDILAHKHYFLEAQAKDNFKNMKVDIFWDKTEDLSKTLSLKSELTSHELDMRFQFLENKGEIYANLVEEGLKVQAKYNDHYIKGKAAHSHEAANYGLEAEIESSFDVMKDVKIVAKAALLKNNENVAVLDSKMLFKWNEIRHSLVLTGEKATKLRAQLVTSSTYAPLDDCIVNLEHEKAGKEMKTLLEASYQGQNITFDLWHSGAKAKEGHVRLSTPFQAIAKIYAEYKLSLGKEIHLTSKFDHNEGSNSINIDANGHLRSGDVQLKADVYHTWGDDISMGVTYKTDISDLAVAANLKIGEVRGFNISGAISTSSDRISVVSSVFQLFCKTNPIDFDFLLVRPKVDKVDLQTKLIVSGTEAVKVSLRAEGDKEEGGIFDSSVLYFDCRFDVVAEMASINSAQAKSAKRFLNATYSNSGTVTNNFLISVQRDFDLNSRIALDTVELKLVSPNLISGASMSFKTSKSSGESTLLVSGNGLNEKFSFSYDHLATPEGAVKKIDLKSSFSFATHIHLDVETKDQTYDEGVSSTTTLRGNWNDANDFVLTAKHVTENQLDQTITLAYEGPKGPFLGSATIRMTVANTAQLEYLLVDSSLKEYSAFVSIYQNEGQFKLFANSSNPDTDPMSMELAALQIEDDTYQVTVLAKIMYPDVWLDAKATMEDDDMGGFTFNGQLEAPGLGIEKQSGQGSVIYGRDVILKMKLKLEGALFNRDSSALIDFGAKKSSKVGLLKKVKGFVTANSKVPEEIYFLKFDVKSTMTGEEGNKDEQLINLESMLSSRLNDLRVALQTSFESCLDVKVIANVANNQFEALYIRNDDKLSALAKLNSLNNGAKIELDSHLESTYHSFARIDLTAKVNLGDSPKTLELSAKSEDGEYNLHIFSALERAKGSLKLTAIAPVVGLSEKDFQIRYNLSPLGGDAVINARGKVYDIHWLKEGNDVTATIITPISGYETIRINSKLVQIGSQHSFDASVSSNEVLNWHVKISLDVQTFAVNLKLKTPYPCLSAFELDAGVLQEWRGLNFALSYLDESLASLKFFLSKDYLETQILGSYKTSHTLIFEYDFNSEGKFIRALFQGNQFAKISLTKNIGQASATLDTNWTGEHSIETTWSLASSNGFITAVASCPNNDMNLSVKYDMDENFIGTIKVESRNLPILKTFETTVTFNAGKPDKQISTVTKWGDSNFVNLNINYKMTEDTFDGTFVIQTSLKNWESTTFRTKYNISAKTSAYVSYEKEGIKKEIRVEVALDNKKPIPTIYITTPFEGYENLILSGDFASRDSRYNADFFVSVNGQKIVVFSNKLTTKADFSTFELVSTLLTPIENWKSMLLEIGYKSTDPWVGKIKFVRDGVEFALRGKVSINDKEFKFNAVTPFEDFENVGLSGKFGTTSIGKQFEVSFEQNTVRRDVSFEYGIDKDNVATLQLLTPLRTVRSVKVQSSMMADSPAQKLNFGFETSGDNNDFAFGLAYDFSQGITNGKVRINVKATPLLPELPELDLNLALTEINSEYSGNLQFNLGGTKYVSAQTTVRKGFASALIQTPVPDYKTILLQLDSDYKSTANLLFELNGVAYSVAAKMADTDHFSVIIKTPVVGYELVTATYEVLPTGTKSIIVERSGVRLTTLLITTDIKPNGGKIDIDWKATANIWGKLLAQYDNGKGVLKLDTASSRLKNVYLEFDVQQGDPKSTYALIFDYNEHHLDYHSSSSIQEGSWEGWSELNTNIKIIGEGKRVTTYKIQFSKDLSVPFTIVYKVLQDNEIDVDIDASLNIQLSKGYDLKIYVLIPRVYPQSITLKSALALEIAGPQKSGKFIVTLKEGETLKYSIGVDGKLSDKDIIFTIKTNIDKLNELKGKVSWATDAANKTKITMALLLNGGKFLQGTMQFDKSPFTRCVILVQKGDGGAKQEIDLRWTPIQRANGRYHLEVTARGFVESRLEGTLTLAEKSAQCDVSAMLNMAPWSFDAASSTSVQFGQGIYALEISTQNNKENRQRKLKAGINIQSPLVASVEVRGTSLPFNLPSLQVTLDYDLSSDLKTMKAEFRALEIHYNLDAKANWSPEASVINILVKGSGDKNIVFKGERKGLSTMNYALDFLGTVIKFESKNNIRSPTDFDLSAKLALPVLDEVSMKFSYSQYVKDSETHSFSGAVAIKQNQKFAIKFVRSKNGEFDLTSTTPIPQMATLEFKHLHTPNSGAVDGYTNEYNLKWNNNNSLALSYFKVGDTYHMSLGVTVDQQKVASLSYKLRYVPGERNFDFDLNSDSQWFNLALALHTKKGGSFEFSANIKSAALGETASVRATYTQGTTLEVTFKQGAREASLICNLSMSSNGDKQSGDLKVDFNNNFLTKFTKVHIKASAVNGAVEKSADLVLNVNSKVFKLEASATKDKELKFKITTPIPGLESLEFEIENDSGKYNVELTYGKEGTANYIDVELTVNNKAADAKSLKFQATRATSKYSLSGEIDFSTMTFASQASWNGKEMDLSTHYENGLLVGDLKTPFKNLEDVRFEGKWKKTASGATFKGFGDVNSLKHTFEAAYVKKENGLSLTWRVAKGASDSLVFELNCAMDGPKKMEAKLSLTGTVISSLLVEGKYEITPHSFRSELSFNTPYDKLLQGKALVHVEFKYPFSYQLKALAKTDQVLFDVDVALSLEATDNKFLRLAVLVPALGVDENDLAIALGYKMISASDFEIVSEASIAGTPRKAILKYKRVDKKLDGELNLQFATRNVQVKFGGELKILPSGGHSLSGYINDCTLDLSHDNNNFSAKVLIDLKNKVLGIYDVVEAGMPNPISIDIRYDHLKAARFAVQLGQVNPKSLRASIAIGTDRVLAEIDINTPTLGHRSASIIIEYGPRGRFEVTVGTGEGTHRMEIEAALNERGLRQGRAALYSPSFGDFQFEMNRGSSSGIIVLSTSRGLHKVSYDIKYTASNDFEVDIQLESPYLNNGHASGKLTVNGESHNYRAMFSLNNDHFLSGSFECLSGGFEAAFGLQSSTLSSDFQVGLSFTNNAQEVTGSFNLQMFSDKHSAKFTVRKDQLYAKMMASSPLMPWITLDIEADLKKQATEYNLGSTVKVGSKTMQINGELQITSCWDITGRFYYFGSGFELNEARLSYRLKINGAQNFFDVILTSDHPSLPEARFAVSAEIISEQDDKQKTLLFSIVTPFSKFETLSGKMMYPNLKIENGFPKMSVFNVSAEVVLPNNLGTHSASLSWNCQKLEQNAEFVYTNDAGQTVSTSVTSIKSQDSYSLRAETATPFQAFSSAILNFDLGRLNGLGGQVEANLNLEWNDNQQTGVKLEYEMRQDECKFVNAEILLPNKKKYAIDLGLKKCSAFKAHLATPEGGLGGRVSYLFAEATNFDLQGEIDLSLLGAKWIEYQKFGFESKLFFIPTSAQKISIVKITLNDHILSGEALLNSIGNRNELTFEGILNKYNIRGSVVGNEDYIFSFDSVLPIVENVAIRGHLKEAISDYRFKLDLNSKGKIVFAMSPKIFDFEMKNIFRSESIKSTLTFEEDSLGGYRLISSDEISWDTTNPDNQTERIEIKATFDPVTSQGDYVIKAFWRNGQTSTLSALNLKSSCDFGTISYLENELQVLGIQADVDSYYTVGRIGSRRTKYSVTLPDRSFALEITNNDWRLKQYEVKFLFGLQRDYPRLQGVSFSHTSDHEGDAFISEKYSLRHIDTSLNDTDRDHSIVLTLRKEREEVLANGTFSRLAKIKVDHPSDDNLRLEIKVAANGKVGGEKFNFDAAFTKKIGSNPLKNFAMNVEADTLKMTVEGNLLNCQNSAFNFKGKVISYESVVGIESFVSKDGHEYADLNAEINTRSPSIQIQSKIGGAKLFAGLQSEKEFGVSLIRVQSNLEKPRIEDFNLFARLTSEDVLTLGATWRPELTRELQQDLNFLSAKIKLCPTIFTWSDLESVHFILDRFQSGIYDELQEVLDAPVTKFYEATTQIVENIKSLKIQDNYYVQKVTEVVAKGFMGAYEICSFAIEKSLRFGVIVFDMSSDLMSSVFIHSKYLINSIVECGKDSCAKISTFFAKYNLDVNEISARLNSIVLSLKTELENFVTWYHNLLESQTGQATIFLRDLVKNIKKDAVVILVQVSGFLKQFRVVNEAVAFYYEYQSWFEEIHFSQHLENAAQQLQTYLDNSTRKFDDLKQSLCKIWKEAKQFFLTKYDVISHYPIFAYVTSAGRRVYRVTCAIVQQFSLDQQFRRMAEKIFGQIDSVASVVVRIVDVIYGRRDLAGYELEYKPEVGILNYNQVLPFKWYSFKEMPDMLKLVQALGVQGGEKDEETSNGEFNFLDFQHDLLDAIHTIGTALATRSLIPPFSARAMVSGDSHLMTFDNKFYDFSGSQGCSYLLTSDFLHNRFSVIANYGEDQKRTSLSVISDKKRIEIETKPSEDGETIKVTVDRRVIELPHMFLHTHIKREGSSLILENSEGLRVVCNLAFDVCSVTVSGWYFGKTGGLLGVYDYEPSNDWMTPERRIADNLQDFVSSWQMDKSRSCQIKFQAPDASLVSETDRQKCSDILGGEDSSLMPCYTTIDVAPFQTMCLSEAAKESGTGLCSAAASYIEQCKLSGIELWMPSECVSCSSGSIRDPPLRSGESTSYKNSAPLSADVVLLVEQTSCLQRYSIADLPSLIDRELNERGLTENRFALVGFGGSDQLAKPHIFTSGSKIFSDAIKTSQSTNNLKSSGIGGHVFGALKYAGRLPYRQGVSKNIILVTCNPGTDGTFYGDAMTMLTEQAITLHHLTAGSFLQWRGSRTRSTDKVHGFSKTHVYTARNLNDIKGDSVLRKQLRDPKDFLSTLATESGGTVFALSKFEANQPLESKKSGSIFGIQVALRAEPAECQVCDCVADSDGVGRLQCHKCILPAMDIVLKNWEQYQQLWTN